MNNLEAHQEPQSPVYYETVEVIEKNIFQTEGYDHVWETITKEIIDEILKQDSDIRFRYFEEEREISIDIILGGGLIVWEEILLLKEELASDPIGAFTLEDGLCFSFKHKI